MPDLITNVDKFSTDIAELNKKLEELPEEEGQQDEECNEILEAIFALEYAQEEAKELAHCHFQMIHYIRARVEETDIEVPETPMQYRQSVERQTGEASSRRLVLQENWQQQPHVARTVDDIIASLRGLDVADTRSQPKPQREINLRARASFYGRDDEVDYDKISVISDQTVVPETNDAEVTSSEVAYSEATSSEGTYSEVTRSEVTVSETGRLEYPSYPESSTAAQLRFESQYRDRDYPRPRSTLPISRPPPTFHPDWRVPVYDSDTESESESEA